MGLPKFAFVSVFDFLPSDSFGVVLFLFNPWFVDSSGRLRCRCNFLPRSSGKYSEMIPCAYWRNNVSFVLLSEGFMNVDDATPEET